MISQEEIKNLTDNANIVDIINNFVDLQKRGTNYIGVCPFHDDSDPSLTVSFNKKIFKCFVCNVRGNVINFAKEFNSVNFIEAVKFVSETTKIKIKGLNSFSKKQKYNNEDLTNFKIYEKAIHFF